jgi:hypothetical protein
MVQVFESDYISIHYLDELKTIRTIWKRNPSSEEYRKAHQESLKGILDFKAIQTCANVTFQGAISPVDRKWFEEAILSQCRMSGLKRNAVIVGKDIFSQYYVENVKKRALHYSIEMRYFDSQEEAEKWLKQSL